MVNARTNLRWRNEMSRVQSLGGGVGDTDEERWLPPPHVPMCESAQVQNNRNRNWPFLTSYQDGVVYVNKAQKQSKYAEASAVGEAWV
jgi:hypothetical protein